MNESSNPKGTPEAASPFRSRKPYVKPVLSHYGHVATLTQSASCAGSNDSATTLACDPTTLRQMNGSDRRVKQDIVLIDSHPLGFGLYLFDYKPEYRDQWGHGRQFGVMADEVEKIVPQAVALHEDGYQVVDYAMLGISRKLH